MFAAFLFAAFAAISGTAFSPPAFSAPRRSSLSAATVSSPWFVESSQNVDGGGPKLSTDQLKAQILQLGAALDRGQSYNPTSGDYYKETMETAKGKILDLIDTADESNIPKTLEDVSGEWELVLTTVKHGIFRSSPFFLAIQEAFGYAEETGECRETTFINKNVHVTVLGGS
uniref:Plastid lipid-associated protein/fibrillin conserved domain-containing protein n=1 Tax=Odontella aurita TaxID=265563 RepID=A0A7S4JBX1_9STRA|mmetsp:Transcript_43419/g.132115  ORF Transcript_43419/g.132115 Transcript_43419/m.132115 type:complete len:172 (+) Transcript_43419:84-599(+)